MSGRNIIMNTITRMTGLFLGVLFLAGGAWGVTTTNAAAVSSEAGGDYAIIVNTANTLNDNDETLRQLVKQLFLKQRTSWPSGAESKPFGRKAGSAEQDAFLKSVLHMTEADLARHWVAQKQKTGSTPPREVGSKGMIIKLVQKYEGAFGVVKTDEAKAAGDAVRILLIFGK